MAETDASGNYLRAWRVPLVTYGKSLHQAEALIGDAVARVVKHARDVGKPIVIERLDFRQKKAATGGRVPQVQPDAVQFQLRQDEGVLHLPRPTGRGWRSFQVNPAYSSVIGRAKFMERYGLSVHQAAALVLARRLLGCSERVPRRRVCPVGNGVQVAFTVPARKRVKHVWTHRGAILGQLKPALAAQHRLGKRRREPNPVQAAARGKSPRKRLERGPDRCSRARFPGGAVLNCWGGGEAKAESSGKAGDGLSPESTFFTTV